MLGLLRVVVGTRVGREGGILREWGVAPAGQCTPGVPCSSQGGRGGGYILESLDTASARHCAMNRTNTVHTCSMPSFV